MELRLHIEGPEGRTGVVLQAGFHNTGYLVLHDDDERGPFGRGEEELRETRKGVRQCLRRSASGTRSGSCRGLVQAIPKERC